MRDLWGRVLGSLAALSVAGASTGRAEVTTASYRETAQSFTWEVRWDGKAPRSPQDLSPPRDEGEGERFWAPSMRVTRIPGGAAAGIRVTLRARHESRVHELDLPQGPRYEGILVLRAGSGAAGDWTRLDRRQLPHLSTPKDTLDTFDACWGAEASASGEKTVRLIVQGAHGPAGRAKKPRKAKSKLDKWRARGANSDPRKNAPGRAP